MINRHIRIDNTIFTDLGILFYNRMRINLTTTSHNNILADINKRADIAFVPYNGTIRYTGQRMNSRTLNHILFIKSQQTGYGFISVWNTYKCSSYRMQKSKVIINQYYRRCGCINKFFISRIGQKRDSSFHTFFYLGKCLNRSVRVSFHLTIQELCYLLRCKLHYMNFVCLLGKYRKNK